MENNKLIPDHVFETFRDKFKTKTYPNIIRTRNITKDGLNILIDKNKVVWSFTVYYDDEFNYIEGNVLWGSNDVLIYFEKIVNETTYKLFILTLDIDNIKMLLSGLNKYYTIDKI
jgi:hypothetical protein